MTYRHVRILEVGTERTTGLTTVVAGYWRDAQDALAKPDSPRLVNQFRMLIVNEGSVALRDSQGRYRTTAGEYLTGRQLMERRLAGRPAEALKAHTKVDVGSKIRRRLIAFGMRAEKLEMDGELTDRRFRYDRDVDPRGLVAAIAPLRERAMERRDDGDT